MEKLVSKKGSQIVYVTKGNGNVVIRAFDKKKHTANTVSIFDELLPGLIAQLSAIAITRRRTTNEAEGAVAEDAPIALSTED